MASNWTVSVAPVNADGKGSATATSVTDPSVQHTVTFGVADGIPNLSGFTQERADYLNSKIVYKAGDIIIVSYPKCGTTWTEQCVLLLLCQGNNDVIDPSHKNTYIPGVSTIGKIWPEACIYASPPMGEKLDGEFAAITLEDFDNAPTPRVIKSHARCEQLLACQNQGLSCLPNGVKTLVVSRNPLDACVSSYYHSFNPFKCGWPFEAWAAVWLTGNVMFGNYFEWVRDWYYDVKRHPEKAMWLQYEDMQTDPRGQIVKIAAFLEISVTDEIVDKVLHYSSFDSMKASAEAKGGNANGHLRYALCECSFFVLLDPSSWYIICCMNGHLSPCTLVRDLGVPPLFPANQCV